MHNQQDQELTEKPTKEGVNEYWKNLSLQNIKEEIDGILYEEEWAGVVGFDKYMVSNFGRVKSLKRTESYLLRNNDPNSPVRTKSYEDKILSQKLHKDKKKRPSYLIVPLRGKVKKFVHVLVGRAFVPNPDNKPFINHLFGIKTDNRWLKLEWCTRKENEEHAWNVLKRNHVVGEQCGTAKLKEYQILEIRERHKNGEGPAAISKDYGVSRFLISNIVARRTWRHI